MIDWNFDLQVFSCIGAKLRTLALIERWASIPWGPENSNVWNKCMIVHSMPSCWVLPRNLLNVVLNCCGLGFLLHWYPGKGDGTLPSKHSIMSQLTYRKSHNFFFTLMIFLYTEVLNLLVSCMQCTIRCNSACFSLWTRMRSICHWIYAAVLMSKENKV
jgi:hypothetical protein